MRRVKWNTSLVPCSLIFSLDTGCLFKWAGNREFMKYESIQKTQRRILFPLMKQEYQNRKILDNINIWGMIFWLHSSWWPILKTWVTMQSGPSHMTNQNPQNKHLFCCLSLSSLQSLEKMWNEIPIRGVTFCVRKQKLLKLKQFKQCKLIIGLQYKA